MILPAFGVTVQELQRLSRAGCTLVDTTCGSVLNVWKNVARYARDGFTSVIHGKYWHEETRATASQAVEAASGHYLVVLDKSEAAWVCDYINGTGDRGGVSGAVRTGRVTWLRPGDPSRAGGLRQPDHDAEHRVDGNRGDVQGRHARPLRRR